MLLVYALQDPRNGEIFYIGSSSTGLARPRAHLEPSRQRDGTRKATHIQAIAALGMKPRILVLQRFKCRKAMRRYETKWIRQLGPVLGLANTRRAA